jgi:CheY-like chemotaxis protein
MSGKKCHENETAGSLGAVLIAEDNPNDAKLAQDAILRLQLENPLRVVRDGLQVLAYLKGEGDYRDREKFPLPALLLLDLRMPEMDGLEVLRRLRGNPQLPSMPVLVVTGHQDVPELSEAYRLGAQSFLTKPINTSDLRNAIQGLGNSSSKLRVKTS